MRQDDREDEMTGAWASFVEAYRRRRAPGALRERIRAAVEEAARAGSRDELLEDRARGMDHGSDEADVSQR